MKKKAIKKKRGYVLMVFSMVPEAIDFYLLPLSKIGKRGRWALKRAHGNYLGAVSPEDGEYPPEEIDKALTYISEALQEDTEAEWITEDHIARQSKQLGLSVERYKRILGSWCQYKLDKNEVNKIPRCRLINTGILM